jgi:hypothetical protein
MNIDRVTPKYIRENKAPVEDMLEQMETFADSIGGPAWRQRRARSTSIERSITLYIDEDQEILDNDIEHDEVDDADSDAHHDQSDIPDIESDSEEIAVAFTAYRTAPDPDDQDITEYSNVYKLSYSTSLPLMSAADMPSEYREKLEDELATDSDAALILSSETDSSEDCTIVETNTLEYTIIQADGSIEYDQFIEYTAGDIHIHGATYSSKIDSTSIHHPDIDKHSEEWLPALLPTEEYSTGTIGDQILIMDDLENIVSNSTMRMEIIGQSSEEHAIRILAILSLISNGIRMYRPRE